jgi:deoxyribodipyrimidine photo-lyase
MTDTAIVWFRRDLRLDDNAALRAAATADRLLPVYCFDPRVYGPRPFGGADSFTYEKTGAHRTRFRRESVAALRESLREAGSDLLVRHGRPEAVLPALVDAVDADAVTCHTWPYPEERAVENPTAAACRAAGAAFRRAWGHTLYHVADLPRPYVAIDDTYTRFRKDVEANASVRDPHPAPALPELPPESPEPGTVPTNEGLGVDAATRDERAALPFAGGEAAGRDRLETYVWERDCLREYKETRNGLLGADYSSKLSPWLNEGCLSPRRVHAEVKRYERERVENESTYWLVFELRWRDFFAFQFAKHGAQFFAPGGIRRRDDVDWRDDGTALSRWRRGETGVPFVDAAMRELNATGYVSNRARQNAASFLCHDVGVDWRRGAAYFETQLVDYDPASNYGNWAYVAGVGNDSRDRSFDVVAQARRYDPDAAYVKRWVPELEPLPPADAHEPWRLDSEGAAYGVELGTDYPRPLVDPTSGSGRSA